MTDLESALAKLRLADELPRGAMLNAREAASLLARLDAADRLADALHTWQTEHGGRAAPIVNARLRAYRNPQPAVKCATCNDTGSVPHPARIVGPQACPDCQYGATPP